MSDKPMIDRDSPLGQAILARGLWYQGDRPAGFIEGWEAARTDAVKNPRAEGEEAWRLAFGDGPERGPVGPCRLERVEGGYQQTCGRGGSPDEEER